MIDTDELERLAREATPGPWQWGFDDGSGLDHLVAPFNRSGEKRVLDGGSAPQDFPENAAYIAAASPDVILALLEERRAMGEVFEAADALLDELDPYAHPLSDHYRSQAEARLRAAVAALQAEPAQEGAPR